MRMKACGFPEGHLPIISVLVVPIKYGAEVIGLFEVANKATGESTPGTGTTVRAL